MVLDLQKRNLWFLKIMKVNREQIFLKCNGHCAYCGKEITLKEMQIDHIIPHWHTLTEK